MPGTKSAILSAWTGGSTSGSLSNAATVPEAVQTAGDTKIVNLSGGGGNVVNVVAFNSNIVPNLAQIYKVRLLLSYIAGGGGTHTVDPSLTVDGSPLSMSGQAPAGFYEWALSKVSDGLIDFSAQLTHNNTLGSSFGVEYLAAQAFYNTPPNAPVSLVPASGAVRQSPVPVFQGTRSDPDAGDGLSGVQIEVRRVSDDVLMWLSSVIAATGSTFSVAYAGSALAQDVTYKWRARTTDDDINFPLQGAWSAYRNFTVHTNLAPTATQVSPSPGAQVGTLTPTMTFSWTDPENDNIGSYQLEVRRVSDGVYFWQPAATNTSAAEKTARQASRVYAGTALVNNTAYEWRVRVTDSFGAQGAYTGWRQFTPKTVPNIPTAITPLGRQDLLTPQIQGVYNQGTGGTEAGFQYEIRQSGITIYQSGDVATVIGTGQPYGTNNPSDTPSSPPALTWGTSYQVRARSKDTAAAYSDWSDWQDFYTNSAPTTPTNLAPAGGAVLGNTTPTLTWQHNDPDGDAQTAVQIYLTDRSTGAYVTGYSPKTLTQAGQSHTVTVALAQPRTYDWQVATRGLAGPGYSPFSAMASFSVANVPVVAVTDPLVGDTETAPGVHVGWSFSGGSGTQSTYRVKVFASDGVTVLSDSGNVSGAAIRDYTIPDGILRTGNDYYVQVIVVDTLAQTAQSTPILFHVLWTPPASITGLSAQAIGSQVVTE